MNRLRSWFRNDRARARALNAFRPSLEGLEDRTLAAGAPPFQVAFSFATSLERDALVITDDYQLFLGRQPEPGAVAFWQGQLQAGLNLADLETRIAGSDEFYARSGNTARGFI